MSRDDISASASIAWIRPLSQPYLRGYRALAERRGSLRGYWFLPPFASRGRRRERAPASVRGSPASLGFFVGYLVRADDYAFFSPEPPECLVFAFVRPIGGLLHRRLVRRPGSLMRSTFEYVRWLTHRPPRFEYYDDQLPAMVRRVSMRGWPRRKYGHFSRNFFIETLAWLVRSALVRKLLAEGQRSTAVGKAARVRHSPPPAEPSLSGALHSR
ncbi:MAG TPA: hypothetical protein VHM88_04675 [Candidatus Acidoferrales bacterium]|nr:hypothetical protein [Candidatus Acidoferrales bacterium]